MGPHFRLAAPFHFDSSPALFGWPEPSAEALHRATGQQSRPEMELDRCVHRAYLNSVLFAD